MKHKPKQIELIMQKRKTDCGIACIAMLTKQLYDDIKPFFLNHRGISPDDMEDALSHFNLSASEIFSLSKTSLVAISWKTGGGHYVVWDQKRKQFLDPLHGIINKTDMLKQATIDFIWHIRGI